MKSITWVSSLFLLDGKYIFALFARCLPFSAFALKIIKKVLEGMGNFYNFAQGMATKSLPIHIN